MILELMLAWATTIHGIFCILAWAGVIAGVGAVVFYIIGGADSAEWKAGVPRFKQLAVFTFVTMMLTTIPTIDDLWKVRVGLLKLELSSPENVKAAGGHLEEIVKALECKHLGVNCPKEAK